MTTILKYNQKGGTGSLFVIPVTSMYTNKYTKTKMAANVVQKLIQTNMAANVNKQLFITNNLNKMKLPQWSSAPQLQVNSFHSFLSLRVHIDCSIFSVHIVFILFTSPCISNGPKRSRFVLIQAGDGFSFSFGKGPITWPCISVDFFLQSIHLFLIDPYIFPSFTILRSYFTHTSVR